MPSAQSITGQVSFVDGVGGSVLSYSAGDSLYVLVNDADRNLDASTLDTVSVYLSSDKEAVEEVLVLTETGNDTHLFTAFMSFDAAGAVASDGTLQVDRGNKLTARYRDPQDDFNNTTDHTTNSFYGMTVINGGTLAGDTTWNPAGSPYLLTGDVTVPLGSVLTIDAGTEVRFTPISDDLTSGEDNNRIELRVEGRLEVNGTATDSVFFKSNGQVPASGDWYGIVSYGNEGEVHVGYSSFNHYTNGVHTTGGRSVTSQNNGDSIYMHHNSFYAGGDAFKSSNYDVNRPIVFLYNQLNQCGIYDKGRTSYRKYEYNTVKAGATYESFEIRNSNLWGSNDGYLSVSYNTFEKGRVYMYDMSITDNATASIHVNNNTFGSGSYGIMINSAYNYTNETDNLDISILNNTIDGIHNGNSYSGYGAYLYLSEKGAKVRFENNQISGVNYGLSIVSGNNISNATINNNSIDSASYRGFYLNRVSGTIESNTLSYCSSGQSAIEIKSDFNSPSIDTLQYNTITGSGYQLGGLSNSSAAVKIDGHTNALINYNNIYNNYSYDIINNVASSVRSQLDAKYNYWGDSTLAEINNGPNPKNISKFYDQYDDSNLGIVNYGQFLSFPFVSDTPTYAIDSNGCVQCDEYFVGQYFLLNGDSIEVVDRSRLLQIVAAKGDLTKVCVSHVTDMKGVFRGAKWFNQDISNWDVSNVTNMVYMFFNAEIFNQDISTWNVGVVEKMTGMFFRADSFNQNINVWDVSNATQMNRMFAEASSFNQPLNTWDVSGVNRMTEMFKSAALFDQDLSSWCVSFFQYNSPANFGTNAALQPQHYPLWGNCPQRFEDVSSLASGAFLNQRGCIDCSALNIGDYFELNGDTLLVINRPMLDSLVFLQDDLSKVCVSHITDMTDALRGLRWFNTDISSWDVSNVIDMSNMFFKALIFNQNIGNWDVSNVTRMNRMFKVAKGFNQNIGDWDVSNVERFQEMFRNADAFNQDIGEWDVSSTLSETQMIGMFRGADNFGQDLSMWCVSNATAKPLGFESNSLLQTAQLPLWGTCPIPKPSLGADTLAICGQDSLTLDAGAGFDSYIWSTGESTQTITVNNSDIYTVSTVKNGLHSADTVLVSVIHPEITSTASTICAGDSSILSVSDKKSPFTNPKMPKNGLIAWYPLNGNANDQSTSGFVGNVHGATPTSDRFGNKNQAYQFDGIDDVINTNAMLGAGQPNLTFSFWANAASHRYNMSVLSQDCDTNCNKPYNLVLNQFLNSAVVCPTGHMSTSPQSFAYETFAHYGAVAEHTVGNWNHYVLVVGDSGNNSYSNFRFFINGIERTIDCGHNWGGWTTNYPVANLVIGGSSYEGAIDDVAIYNRSLTNQEVQQLYFSGNRDLAFNWSTGDTTETISVSPTASTTYYCTISDGVGSCLDSITVSVVDVPDFVIDTAVCSSYDFAGNTITTTGTYYDTLTANSGCDSLIVLNLHVDNQSVYHVSQTGNDSNSANVLAPLQNIQTALNRACDGDTVLVASGTYYEHLDMGYKKITLIGAGADSTVIDAKNQGMGLIIRSSQASVVGFGFKNGGAPNYNIKWVSSYGYHNVPTGILSGDQSQQPLIKNCAVYDNQTGIYGNAVVEESRVYNNTIGLQGYWISPQISQSAFYGNDVALHISNASNTRIENSIIRDNQLALHTRSDLNAWSFPYSIINSSIVFNAAFLNSSEGAYMRVINSIIYENGDSNFIDLNQAHDSAYVTHSIIGGGINAFKDSLSLSKVNWGIGNLDVNPNFSDSLLLHLSPQSPAIGAADSMYSPAVDFYGAARPNPMGSNPDIGAVESQEASPMCPVVFNNLYNITADLSQLDSVSFDVGFVNSYSAFQWQFNAGLGWFSLGSNGLNFSGGQSQKLTLHNLQSSFNGITFRCIITNPLCTDTTNSAQLFVIGTNPYLSKPISLIEVVNQFLDLNNVVINPAQATVLIKPNPTTGIFSVEPHEKGTYQVINQQGRVVDQGFTKEAYDLSKFPQGVYVLRLMLESQVYQIRVLKQ